MLFKFKNKKTPGLSGITLQLYFNLILFLCEDDDKGFPLIETCVRLQGQPTVLQIIAHSIVEATY